MSMLHAFHVCVHAACISSFLQVVFFHKLSESFTIHFILDKGAISHDPGGT